MPDNSINEMNNTLESIGNRANHMKDRICELKVRNLEMTEVEEERVRYKKN